MTTRVFKLVGFDRKTDNVTVQHVVPRALVGEALKIAHVNMPGDKLGDIPLSSERARKIGEAIRVKIDTNANEYFLEVSAPSLHLRRRATG